MTDSYDLERDLQEAHQMISVMAPYVLQSEVYYHIGSDLPRMTIGSFLLRFRRLHWFKEWLSPEQLEVLDEIDGLHSQVIQEWHYHYTLKLFAEAKARLAMLDRYLLDCEESPADCLEFYRPEAFRRTLIQEVVNMIKQLNVDDLEGIQKLVADLDKRLQPLLKKTDFLWDEALQEVYPEDEYWWLYRQPVKERVGTA